MRARRITIGIATVGLASLTGLTVATANSVGRQPARGVVSHRSDDPEVHDAADDRGRDVAVPTTAATTPSTTVTGATTVTTVDGRGIDDPATHDVGDDRGIDDPATHDHGGHGTDG